MTRAGVLNKHPDGLLRHGIQNPECELIVRKQLKRPDSSRPRQVVERDPLARCAAARAVVDAIRPVRWFRPFPFTLSDLDGW
jgi:hypothetical protein